MQHILVNINLFGENKHLPLGVRNDNRTFANTGDKGTDGTNGIDGINGSIGHPGKIGPQGLLGSPGPTGRPGSPGPQGVKGFSGMLEVALKSHYCGPESEGRQVRGFSHRQSM